MRRLLVLFFFLLLGVWIVWGEGPVFNHKDPIEQQEFDNAYKDIRSIREVTLSSATLPGYATSYIQNVNVLQSGATFFVSSGTVSGTLTATTISATTVNASTVNATTQVIAPVGVTLPGHTFSGDLTTGVARSAASQVSIILGGSTGFLVDKTATNLYASNSGAPALRIQMDQSQFAPVNDNAMTCGANGARWSAVWAANGTIQTSSSRLKKSIREIDFEDTGAVLNDLTTADIPTKTFNGADDPASLAVPRGIVFKWKTATSTMTANADVIGFVGDDLPQEAHALRPDGTRDPENFYTSAVVGILCAAVKKQGERLAALEAEVEILKSR